MSIRFQYFNKEISSPVQWFWIFYHSWADKTKTIFPSTHLSTLFNRNKITNLITTNVHKQVYLKHKIKFCIRHVHIVMNGPMNFTMSICLSAHISVQLPLDGFPWNLLAVAFLKMWLISDKNVRQFTWRPKSVLLLPAT